MQQLCSNKTGNPGRTTSVLPGFLSRDVISMVNGVYPNDGITMYV